METRPNPYKIPPRTMVIEADPEIPVNHRENILFCFLGALAALIFSLCVYEAELAEQWRIDRAPASVTTSQSDPASEFNPYQNLPSLF